MKRWGHIERRYDRYVLRTRILIRRVGDLSKELWMQGLTLLLEVLLGRILLIMLLIMCIRQIDTLRQQWFTNANTVTR